MEKKNLLTNTEVPLSLYQFSFISAVTHDHMKCSLVIQMEFLQSKLLKCCSLKLL